MDREYEASEERFEEYVGLLASALGRRDREQPFRDYCTGLLMPGERKSVEPMAAVVAPAEVSAKHQSLLHLVSQAKWSDETVLAKIRELVMPTIEAQGPIEAWIVDDTSFAKKGVHSVGVTHQYSGRLGKTTNCQVAVSLSLANHAASLPIAYGLYLPQEWADDVMRRHQAHVPEEVVFKTKPQIALDQIRTALEAGVTPGVVLADAGYGVDGAFRSGLSALGLHYVVGVQSTLSVWPVGVEPLPPKPRSGRGRPPSRLQRDGDHHPVSAKELAMRLAEEAWRTVTWREGSNQPLSSRFAAVRIRPASRDWKGALPHPFEWLLVEWPEGEKEPIKFWLSTLPEDTPIEVLVDKAQLRWRIERDYQELKGELGLAHFEGRSWRGFHHHATLCIAAYGFLICERSAIPPSASRRRQAPSLSARPKPRGASDPARTAHSKLNRHDPTKADRRARQNSRPLPLLPSSPN
jgi:SRSO17 transposase